MWTTYAGWLRCLRNGCGRQVRRVGLDEQAVERGALGGLGEVLGLRVRDVAGERDPPAVVEAFVEPAGHREAVQDHLEPGGVLGERGDRVVLGRAGVDHQRLAELARQLDLRAERALLVGARRVVAVVVEAGLADRQAARVGGELAQLVCDRVRVAGGVVGVVADRGVHLVVLLGGRERRAPRALVDADVRMRLTPSSRAAASSSSSGAGAAVEVGVRVDHCGLGNRGGSFSTVRRRARRRRRRRSSVWSGWPSAASSFSALGRHVRREQHGHDAQALGERAQRRVELRRLRPRPWRAATARAPRRSGSGGGRAARRDRAPG